MYDKESREDSEVYDTLCDAIEKWFLEALAPLRFARMQ
jgi:hypothetical protein